MIDFKVKNTFGQSFRRTLYNTDFYDVVDGGTVSIQHLVGHPTGEGWVIGLEHDVSDPGGNFNCYIQQGDVVEYNIKWDNDNDDNGGYNF